MLAIYKKELRGYFISPIGYVYMAIFLAISALVFCFTTLQAKSYDTSMYYYYMIFAFIILIPLLTMRSFAEEKKLRTEQMLLTAPVTLPGMVIGKYLAALTMFLGSVAVSCINFIPLFSVAAEERAGAEYESMMIGPSGAAVIGGLIGLVLLGSAFLAIGIFISSLTESQLSAAVVSVGVIVLMVGISLIGQIGNDADGTRLISSPAVRFVLDWISVLGRFMNFYNGLFDWAAALYYLSLTGVFLFLTVRVYEHRRFG